MGPQASKRQELLAQRRSTATRYPGASSTTQVPAAESAPVFSTRRRRKSRPFAFHWSEATGGIPGRRRPAPRLVDKRSSEKTGTPAPASLEAGGQATGSARRLPDCLSGAHSLRTGPRHDRLARPGRRHILGSWTPSQSDTSVTITRYSRRLTCRGREPASRLPLPVAPLPVTRRVSLLTAVSVQVAWPG
jgi:hypothetical protein